jgi:hypothetical protein
MGIALRRLGSHGVNLVVFHGHVGPDALIGFYRGIDPEDSANALPWLTYIAPDADVSEIDLATLIELRRTLEPVRQSVERKYLFCSVVVSGSDKSDALVAFWRDFVRKESDHPPYTILFSDVRAACQELNLPDSAPEAILLAIRAACPQSAVTP